MKRLLSCSMAAVSPTSKAYLTARFVKDAAICDLEAIFLAIVKAASCSFGMSGRTWLTRPNLRAS